MTSIFALTAFLFFVMSFVLLVRSARAFKRAQQWEHEMDQDYQLFRAALMSWWEHLPEEVRAEVIANYADLASRIEIEKSTNKVH